ncbi:MAG TPA: TIGR02996 domain-containing protein [Gemmataceae bacterium]|jgi:uncharacterized protein (TIGR02996 family)
MKDNRLAKAFLQAIHDNPEDNTPRLVYADWLEENGDSARAEFIRVQCEKVRLPRWHRRWSLLAWRERVLLGRHEHVWRAELPEILGVEWGAFERGFVHEVRVDNGLVLSDHAEEICRSAPVRWATITGYQSWPDCPPVPFLSGLRLELDLNALHEEPDRVFQSPLLSKLKALDLSGLNMEGEQFVALGRTAQLGNLETLRLDDCFMGNGNLRPFAESAQFRNLTTLSMKGNRYGYYEDARIRPADAALLARSPYLTQLRSLDVTGNEIDGPALFDLLESPHLTNLRELTLSNNRIAADDMPRLFEVQTGTRLHRLALDHNPIGDAGAQVLAGAAYCAELLDLDLDTCEITAKGVRTLTEAPWFGGLRRLNLNHNSAAADGAFALTRGCGSGELVELHLRDNELDMEAVTLLADSPSLRGLQTLDLSDNPLDEDGLRAVAASPHWTQLRELHLERCKLNGANLWMLTRAACLPGLLHLSLSDNALGDKALSLLLAGGKLSHAHQLTLRSCGFARDSTQALADAGLPELHWLDLSGNKIDGLGVEVLARSPLAASLVELDLDGNNMGDAGALSIAARTWPLLTKLALASNHLTDKGARALAGSPDMPRLREVHCRNNRIEWRLFQQLGPRFRQY